MTAAPNVANFTNETYVLCSSSLHNRKTTTCQKFSGELNVHNGIASRVVAVVLDVVDDPLACGTNE